MVHVTAGQFADGSRQGRREEGGLSFAGSLGQDGLDIFDKAHREHLVGFIEHDCFDLADIEGIAVEQVDQPAGGADHHIHAAVEAADLWAVGLPAINGQHAHCLNLAKLGDRLGNLQGELAGGAQDQRLNMALSTFKVV